jgi:hypothetical protein
MVDTSYRPDYAPFANSGFRQTSIPATAHNLPATVGASSSATSSLIVTEGYGLISVGLTSSQNGTLSVQRYLDAGGTVVQGASQQVALTANAAANLDVTDGKPFAAFKVTVTNSGGSTATLSNLAILVQISGGGTSSGGSGGSGGSTGSDGSTTVTTGGTAQNLFGGVTPTNGFSVYNPDAVNDLWLSDSTTAAANGQGSIRIVANGGGYETPPGYKPFAAVSIVGAVTGQKITARRW